MTAEQRQTSQARLEELHHQARDWAEASRPSWGREQLTEVTSCYELMDDFCEEERAEHARLHQEVSRG